MRLILVLMIMGCGLAQAQVFFEQRELEQHASEDATELYYRFVYESAAGLTFEGITASCGCTQLEDPETVAELFPEDAEATDRGFVYVRFSIGSRQGRQQKSLKALFRDAEGELIEEALTFVAHIPDPLHMRRSVLLWTARDHANPPIKDADLAINAEREDVHFLGIDASEAPSFHVHAYGPDGAPFDAEQHRFPRRISVVPKAGIDQADEIIYILTDHTSERHARRPLRLVKHAPES